MIAVFTIFSATFADEHYEKIISLNKKIKPGVSISTRDKLRAMVDILSAISSIPIESKNYTINEINELLDILLRIVEINRSFLRYEKSVYVLTNLLKDKNLKEDAIEFDKIIKMIKVNQIYRARSNKKNLTKYYVQTADIFLELKMDNRYVQVYTSLLPILFNGKRYSNLYYDTLKKVLKKNKSHQIEKMNDLLIFHAIWVHSKRIDLALEIFEHCKSSDKNKSIATYFQAKACISRGQKEKALQYMAELDNIKGNDEQKAIKLKDKLMKSYNEKFNKEGGTKK